MASLEACPALSDDTFGPTLPSGCGRKFDFTLLFEECALSLFPAAIFLLLLPFRLFALSKQRRVVGGNLLNYIKLVSIVAYCATQVALLAVWLNRSTPKTRASVATAAVYLIACLCFAPLSHLEHCRSLRSSLLLNWYLILSIPFDSARARTLWNIHYSSSITVPFLLSIAFKIIILLLQELNKARFVFPSEGDFAPEETAGVFSRSLFLWLNRLIYTGYSNILLVETLPRVDRQLQADHLWTSFIDGWKDAPKTANTALQKHIFSTFKWQLLAPVIPTLFTVALAVTQPLLMHTFLTYLSTPDDGDDESRYKGYGLIGAYGLTFVCSSLATAWAQQLSFRFASMVRGCLVAVIYRHTTTVNAVGLDDSSAVSLMSTDVERIVSGLTLMHTLWSTPLQIGISLFLLYRQVSSAFVVPLLLFLFCGAAVSVLAGQAGARQAGWMKAIEKRIGATSSMISSIKGVKFSGLSTKMYAVIQALRLDEISAAGLYRSLLVYVVILSYVPNTVAPIITFGVFATIAAKSGVVLDSTRIFTALSLLSLITEPLTQLFHALPEFGAAVGCFSRIQVFLLSESREDYRQFRGLQPSSVTTCDTGSNMEAKTCLGLEPKEMEVNVHSSDPDAAISIENGVFSWKKDEAPTLENISLTIPLSKLTMIIGQVGCGKTTLLKAILGEVPHATGSIVLSSKNIAFCDQNVWLTNQTMQQNITGYSKHDTEWYSQVLRACALDEVVRQLPNGDQTMIGSKGITLSGGQKQRVSIARAVYSRLPIAIFDDVFSGLDSETQKHVFQHVFGISGLLQSQGTTVILATHGVHLLPRADSIIALQSDGKGLIQDSFENLNMPNGYLRRFNLIADNEAQESPSTADHIATEAVQLKESSAPTEQATDKATRQQGDWKTYKYYFQTVGNQHTLVFLALLVLWVAMMKVPEIWLKLWGDSNERSPGSENGKYLGIYTVIQIMGLVALALDIRHLIANIVVKSGIALHSKLLTTVLGAPMAFFATVDNGSIINRFSQDIQLVDAELPISLLNTAANTLVAIAQAIMLLPASYWLAVTYPFLVGTLYSVQKYYLRTSRQLRFLDLEAKSPLYSHFMETIAGLVTIRAFSWQDDLIRVNERSLDSSQRPFYLLYMIQRWLNLVLDLMTSGLAIVLTAVAIATKGSSGTGFAGIALYNIMTLSNAMRAAVNVWTILETSIGAVSRIRNFQEQTASESLPRESKTPPENWPSLGELRLENVTAAYSQDGPLVLDSLNLSIKAGEKFGICGPSGSGKSSLLLSIFRMIELRAGSIHIDNEDITTLPRETIRERLNAIPQDPLLLMGNVRENCDPQGKASDGEIVEVLTKTCLWEYIEGKGGLETIVTQDIFSNGQKQLFCLARSLLHKSKIVVMDEATSGLDIDTEKAVQRVLRSSFADTTVIAITHRLETIVDFDTVVVIDQGCVVEKGNPRELLLDEASQFKKLYETYRQDDGQD